VPLYFAGVTTLCFPAFSIEVNRACDSALRLASFLLPIIRESYHEGLTLFIMWWLSSLERIAWQLEQRTRHLATSAIMVCWDKPTMSLGWTSLPDLVLYFVFGSMWSNCNALGWALYPHSAQPSRTLRVSMNLLLEARCLEAFSALLSFSFMGKYYYITLTFWGVSGAFRK
jgi:hypothetical protein